MQISYENTSEDSIALFNHQLKVNKDYKQRKFLNLVFSPILIFSVCTIYGVINKESVTIAIGSIIALLLFFWHLYKYSSFYSKSILAIKQSDSKNNFYCNHNITITKDGFAEETSETKSFLTWNAIVDIAFTSKHIFVYNTTITAHVIPLRELGDTVFNQVKDEIRKHMKNSNPI